MVRQVLRTLTSSETTGSNLTVGEPCHLCEPSVNTSVHPVQPQSPRVSLPSVRDGREKTDEETG